MATINPTVTRGSDHSVMKFKFETLTTANDNGASISFSEWADRSVQVTGTFGSGGTLKFQGSNDSGQTWADLTDPQGNAISFTSAGLETVTEITELARPYVSAGDGSTDLDVFILCRRPTDMRS